MGREIKFRAWHKAEEVMGVDGEFCSFDFITHKDGERLTTGYDLHEAIASDYVEVMQYTGLKDKNGVEIYEGDLYRSTHNQNVIYQVRIKMGCVVGAPTGIDPDGEPLPYDDHYGWNEKLDWLVVVGNIHENPELMTQ